MNTSPFKLTVFFLLISWIGNAQKYTSIDSTVVTKSWNGTTFSSIKTFAENIAESSELSLLKKAMETTATAKTIEDQEMVTVFAITNKGFAKYQEKKDSIFSVSNAPFLASVIKFHSIPGRVDRYSLKNAIKRSHQTVYYATLQGEKIGIKEENGQLYLVDSEGNTSLISATDFYHKNGFFHIVDGIVYPTKK